MIENLKIMKNYTMTWNKTDKNRVKKLLKEDTALALLYTLRYLYNAAF